MLKVWEMESNQSINYFSTGQIFELLFVQLFQNKTFALDSKKLKLKF